VTPSSLRKIAEKTIARISSLKIPHNSSSIGITASAGFYANSEGLFPEYDDLILAVDNALYQAKKMGKNMALPASSTAFA
ncbi:MAG: diguanylate cyclase, partial [Nitrospirae bacterium]|nr:diguanylate cyclase [Nitrospirota bacterium]